MKNLNSLVDTALTNTAASKENLTAMLTDPELDIHELLHAAYKIRKHYWGNKVRIHKLNNVKNGLCPEDCHYCSQAKDSKAPIEKYPTKPKDEILNEAKLAYESGSFRYCMVLSGRGPSDRQVNELCDTIRQIKSDYGLEVCLSAGLMNDAQTKKLKEAGLNRMNHNLNTSKNRYPSVCTTHTYEDRMNTLLAAKRQGLETCSGLIVGMGETPEDLVDVALELKALETPSIPVNFFIPIEGTNLEETPLTPDYVLRVLSMMRFANPSAEIRVAAGRELHLRHVQCLSLYPANSLFTEGYLNAKGSDVTQTLQMIKDAGFDIDSQYSDTGTLLEQHTKKQVEIKTKKELRPVI